MCNGLHAAIYSVTCLAFEKETEFCLSIPRPSSIDCLTWKMMTNSIDYFVISLDSGMSISRSFRLG